MVKKRRSGGRTGSSGGHDVLVACNSCGHLVPRGKAKRVTKRVNFVDATIGRELREAGAIMPNAFVEEWFCVSCAIHRHKVHIRPGDERKKHTKIY